MRLLYLVFLPHYHDFCCCPFFSDAILSSVVYNGIFNGIDTLGLNVQYRTEGFTFELDFTLWLCIKET